MLSFRAGRHAEAAGWFRRALELVPGGRVTVAWEPLIVNLGHALRKLSRLAEAAQEYERALGLNPAQPGVAPSCGGCGPDV